MASVTIRGLGLSPRLLANRIGGQKSPSISPMASPSVRRFSSKKGASERDVTPNLQSKSAGVSPAVVHYEKAKLVNVTPGVPLSYVQETKNTFPLPTKSPEQFWDDLQDNLQETLWYRTEQASGEDLQFYRDWKKNSKPEWVSPNPRQTQVDFSQIKSVPHGIVEWDKAKLNPKGMSALDMAHLEPRKYLNDCGEKLGVRNLNDWYSHDVIEFKKVDPNASKFLAQYGNSLIQALIANFPEHDWKIQNFDFSFRGTIFDGPNKTFMNNIQRSLSGDHSPEEEDWRTTMNRYKSHWQVTDFATSKGNSLGHEASFFSRINLNDDSASQLSGTHAKQVELNNLVKRMFPETKVESTHTDPSLVYSDTKRPFALHSFIPEYNIAFEIIEDPNFTWQYAFGAQIPIYTFNKSKRIICEKNGISLVQVPSWWDPISSPVSHLINAIRRVKPELADKINNQVQKPAPVPLQINVTAPKETEVEEKEGNQETISERA